MTFTALECVERLVSRVHVHGNNYPVIARTDDGQEFEIIGIFADGSGEGKLFDKIVLRLREKK